MRTIKFRGKRCDNGEWVYGIPIRYIRNNRSDRWTMHDGRGKEYDIDENTVGQFTGLLDKNGKEIYEGDIVEATSIRYGYKDFMKKMLCEIVYNNDFCCFDFLASDRQRFICTSIADVEIEVIGNIHDNPELMEGGEK